MGELTIAVAVAVVTLVMFLMLYVATCAGAHKVLTVGELVQLWIQPFPRTSVAHDAYTELESRISLNHSFGKFGPPPDKFPMSEEMLKLRVQEILDSMKNDFAGGDFRVGAMEFARRLMRDFGEVSFYQLPDFVNVADVNTIIDKVRAYGYIREQYGEEGSLSSLHDVRRAILRIYKQPKEL